MTHGRQLPYGINETDSNGDVPSPETNIPQNGNAVNSKNEKIEASAESKVTLDVKKSTDNDDYTYDSIAIMLDGKEVGTIGMMVDENEAANHDRTDNIMSFDRGKVELRIGGKEYSAEVIIGVRKDGSKVFYDIVGMDANKKAAPIGSQSAQTANTEAQEPSDNISSNDSITDTSENFKSKSENSAAKAQQAETEKEARLRTLYESEPTGKYAGTEAGESKPMYAVIEIDTKGNYRGTIEKANVLVTAFGTDLNYIENQAAKGTELKIKK